MKARKVKTRGKIIKGNTRFTISIQFHVIHTQIIYKFNRKK